MSLALLLILRALHFNIYLAAKPRLKPTYKHHVSRGGECTMANYVEARNSRKISKKSQTEQTDKSTTEVNREEPDIVRSGALTEPSAASRIGIVATGPGRAGRRPNCLQIALFSADIDYRFARGR